MAQYCLVWHYYDIDFGRPFTCVTPTLDGDVLRVLTRTRRPLSLGQIHELVGAHSLNGIRRVVFRLVETGVVVRASAGRQSVYQLNRNHVAAQWIEGLATLREQVWARLREHLDGWDESPAAAAAFGSAARGEATDTSDLDLCVVRRDGLPADNETWVAQLSSLPALATRWTGNDARVVEFGEQELLAAGPLLDDLARDAVLIAGPADYFARALQRRSVA
jgi:hypothetical protein